jgi:hypothetical protein
MLSLQNDDYSINAGILHDGKIIEEPHWSKTRGCHQIKTIISLLKSYEISIDKKYLESAINLFKWGSNLQLETGRFAISKNIDETYAHAHCYAIEGLLKYSEYMNNEFAFNMACKGAKWLSDIQNADGSISNWHESSKSRIKVCDVTSQAIRIWTIISENGAKDFTFNIGRALSFMSRMQYNHNDSKETYGGVRYGINNGSIINHVNSWATIFYTQSKIFLNKKNGSPLENMII